MFILYFEPINLTLVLGLLNLNVGKAGNPVLKVQVGLLPAKHYSCSFFCCFFPIQITNYLSPFHFSTTGTGSPLNCPPIAKIFPSTLLRTSPSLALFNGDSSVHSS